MYPNTDAALRQAYKIWAVRIEPMGNTAQVCEWLQSKGVKGGGSGLTQHEHHAESAMIIARVQRLLEPAELAVIEMHYTDRPHRAAKHRRQPAFVRCAGGQHLQRPPQAHGDTGQVRFEQSHLLPPPAGN